MASPIAKWVVPVPGGSRNTTSSRATTKSRVPRWAMVSRLRPRGGRSRTPPGSCEPGGPDPALAAVRPRAETSRCRQAIRNSSCVHPRRELVRPAGPPTRAGWAPSTPGSERPPRRPDPAVSWRGSGRPSLISTGVGAVRPRCRRATAARPRVREQSVAGRFACAAAPSRPRRARGPDCRGVDRVVVGVQPDVVITRQPGRGAPSGRLRHRRLRRHRLPISSDPIARGAAQRAAGPGVHHREPVGELGVENPPGRRRCAPGRNERSR